MSIYTTINVDYVDFGKLSEDKIEQIQEYLSKNKSDIERLFDITFNWNFYMNSYGQSDIDWIQKRVSGWYMNHVKALLFVLNKFDILHGEDIDDCMNLSGVSGEFDELTHFLVSILELDEYEMTIRECELISCYIKFTRYGNVNMYKNFDDKLEPIETVEAQLEIFER